MLRALRERELHDALLSQWRQSMTAPDWRVKTHAVRLCELCAAETLHLPTSRHAYRDLDDYDWRPTFLPSMRSCALDATQFFIKPCNRLFAAYAARVAVLEQPKRALRVLGRDDGRMPAFRDAVMRAAAGAAQKKCCSSAWRRATSDANHATQAPVWRCLSRERACFP